jgi:hypothetical protein
MRPCDLEWTADEFSLRQVCASNVPSPATVLEASEIMEFRHYDRGFAGLGDELFAPSDNPNRGRTTRVNAAPLIEVKMYSDYKSPFAWLAFDPAFELQNRYRVRVRWIPFQLRIKEG